MKFNESMIKNYKELNNCGTFEIEGYTVKFNNHSKTLETEYPYAKELRAWWFDLEEETEEDKRVKFIKENGFVEVTEIAVTELESMTTKGAKTVLERMQKFNHRVYRKGETIIVFGMAMKTLQERKQLEKIYNCKVQEADLYFDENGMLNTWNQLAREMWAMGSAF